MSWITLTSVTATNGQKTVAVNSGSTATIKIGDALKIGAFDIYEIEGVFANQLTLRDAWAHATQTNAKAVVVPTFGDFNAAVEAMRSLTEIAVSNLTALEQWGTQTGTVNFQGQDGETHTARTLLQMDADVQEKTDAVQQATDEMVSLLGAQVALNQPDMHIPFNDSLQIVRGFGTHDKIDVSPAQDGSIMVDLPTKSVDFSRASGRYSINKSGELVQLGIDEAGITKGGMESYQSYVNLMTDSGNAAAWSKSGYTVTQSSVLGPDAESFQAFSVIESAGNEIHRIIKGIPVTEAHTYSVKVIAKALGTERANLRIESGNIYGNTVGVNLLTGEHVMAENSNNPIAVEVKVLKDGWVQVDITGVAKETRSTGFLYVYFCPTNGRAFPLSWQGDGVSGGLIRAIQATETPVPMPYIESGSNPVASGDDVATIPLRNNLPAPGESFSISVKAHIPNTKAAVFGLGLEQFEKLTLWRFDKDNPVRVRINDTVQTLSITSGQIDTHKPCKYTIVFDADVQTLSFYVDKELAESVDVSTVDWSQVYSPSATGYVGRCATVGGNAAPLNSSFKDLKFFPYALSAEQIRVEG
ncbi:phage head spike fiber domain-containing protein [Vibrio parahaemolyticus]